MPFEPLGQFSYSDLTLPAGYRCTKCGAHGIKLWREYNTFLDHQNLLCAFCLDEKRGSKYGPPDENGRCSSEVHGGGYKGDECAGMIPAVPTEDGETFWGFTSVPSLGVAWWRAIPTRMPFASEADELAAWRRYAETLRESDSTMNTYVEVLRKNLRTANDGCRSSAAWLRRVMEQRDVLRKGVRDACDKLEFSETRTAPARALVCVREANGALFGALVKYNDLGGDPAEMIAFIGDWDNR